MNRRTLLQGLMAGAPLLAAPPLEIQGIIDAHVHFYDPGRPQSVPWPSPRETSLYRPMLPESWSAIARPLGVSAAIVVEASPWLEDNQWVLDLAKQNPLIAGFVGRLEPGQPEFRANLARFRLNPLFRGIRLGEKALRAVLDDPAAFADLQRLAGADLTLDVLGSSRVLLDVAKLSDRLPDLRIVVDHLPFAPPGGALQPLRERPRVYAKVSGVLRRVNGRVPDDAAFYREDLNQLWEVFGTDRLIYASNWPVSELLAPYATVLKVAREYFESKGLAAARKFFRTNAVSAYKISAPTPVTPA